MNDNPPFPSRQLPVGFLAAEKSLLRPHSLSHPRAFTLIELLVVIGIIAVLAALLFPALGKMSSKAAITKNVSNLRQLAIGVHAYASQNGHYPPASSATYQSPEGTPGTRWPDLVSRQLGVFPSELFLSPTLKSHLPPDLGFQPTNYAGNPQIFKRGDDASMVRIARVTSGSVILLGDVTTKAPNKEHKNGNADFSLTFDPSVPSAWDQPATFGGAADSGRPDYRNEGKAAFVFVDGHVELLAEQELLRRHFAIDKD